MTYDLIDKIYKPTGVTLTTPEGDEYSEMELVEGYHINVLDLTDDERIILEPFMVTVSTPKRVFAGRNDVVCLKFADRQEWLDLGFEITEVENG